MSRWWACRLFSGPPLGRRNGCRPRAPAAPARGVGMGAKAGCVLAGLTLEVGTGAVQSRVADGGGDCVTGNRSELPASRSSACGTQSGPAVHHLGQLLPCLAQSWVCRAPVPRQTHPHIHAFQHLVFIYQYTRDHAAPHISIYTLNNLVFEPNGGQQSCWEIASLVGLVTGTSRPSRVQLSRWLDQKLECGLTRMLPGHLLVKYSRHVGQEQGPGADSGEGGEINCFLAGLGTCLSRRCGSSSAMKKKVWAYHLRQKPGSR